jgi:hypothetical protein
VAGGIHDADFSGVTTNERTENATTIVITGVVD